MHQTQRWRLFESPWADVVAGWHFTNPKFTSFQQRLHLLQGGWYGNSEMSRQAVILCSEARNYRLVNTWIWVEAILHGWVHPQFVWRFWLDTWTALLFKLQLLEVYFELVCLVVYVLDRTTLIIRLVEVYANAPQDRHLPPSYSREADSKLEFRPRDVDRGFADFKFKLEWTRLVDSLVFWTKSCILQT